MKDWNKQPF